MLKLLGSEWFEAKLGHGARFRIRGLSGLEFMELQRIMENDFGPLRVMEMHKSGNVALSPGAVRHAWRCGVEDWDGTTGADGGDPLPFSIAAIEWLPNFNLMREVAYEIVRRSQLDEETEKNSASQSRSPATGPATTAKTAAGAGAATKRGGRRRKTVSG